MRLTSFNGVTFASLNLAAGIPRGTEPGPDMRSALLERRGYSPLHVGVTRGAKILEVDFGVLPGFTMEESLWSLLGVLDPYDDTERVLAGLTNASVSVQAYAALAGYRWEGADTLFMAFSLADPVWRKTTVTTTGPVSWPAANGAVLAVPNAGKARANLDLVIKPTALDTSVDSFGLRRTITVTNNSDTILRKFPLELDLGNTGAWTSTVSANADKTWIFLDGIAQSRELIGWSEAQTFCWILVDELAPAASFTYDICWEGLTNANSLTGVNRPAFDIGWEKNNATAGGASTITKSSATWRTDQWRRGQINILSGLGSGQSRKIASNSATVITTESAWSTNPDATSVFLLTMSHNDRWVYDVSPVSRSNLNRGLWYQNKGQTKPSSIVFDNPGNWYRHLLLDNNDEKNQSRTFAIDVGGGDIDYFNGLDADRTAQGWTALQEEGQADSVAFSSPVEIDGWRYLYALKNPNAICRAKFGSRESGAEDWEWNFEDAAAFDTLTLRSTQDHTFTTDIRHLIAHLGPVNDEVIPVSWKRDTGSRTGGGSTTLQDSSKEWATDQWVNGSVRITAGTGLGQRRTITSNTSVMLSVSVAWNPLPSDDSRFEVINKKAVGTLRGTYIWEVRLNTTKVIHGAVSSEIFPNYDINASFSLGGGPNLTAPYQGIRLGQDGRRILIAGTDELRIDGEARRAAIYTTATGAKVKDVTAAVRFLNRETDGIHYLAPDWLLVQPTPANVVTNPDFLTDTSGWSSYSTTALVTAAVTRDGAQGHLANGSLSQQITASTAAAGAMVQWATPATAPYFTVIPGRSYTVTAWGRRLNSNWVPKLGIYFYDSTATPVGTASIGGTVALGYVNTNTTWMPLGHTETAPTAAAFARVLAIAWEVTNSTTGQVWFDEVQFNTAALFMQGQGQGVTANVTATLTEGYYG